MQRLTESEQHVIRLAGGHLDDVQSRLLRRVAARQDRARLRRTGKGAGRGIVTFPRQFRSQVVLGDACVGKHWPHVLHVARFDALVADGDGLGRLFIETRLQRQPLRQSEVHIAFES